MRDARTLPNGAAFRYDGCMLRLTYVSFFSLALLTTAVATSLAACSSDSTGGSSGTTTDAAGGNEGGSDGGADTSTADTSVADSATGGLNDCNTFVDRTAAGAVRTLTWDFPIATSPDRCIMIKKGQDVTFSGDFAEHPLNPQGGDSPNPFANVDTMTGKVPFAAAGLFGFQCGNHPSMTGAVKVVE
jgi:hypothetical protein